ncbi:MAG: hypothetical protein P1V51_15260 [Deltaproteobacteria bacterium]|nr:hypothetical protein [Deltaproteobacteria bacterium]
MGRFLLPLLAALALLNVAACGGKGDTPDGGSDAGTDAGGCQMNTQCPAARPICEVDTATCRACASDAECGAGFVCEAAGSCGLPPAVCATDNDCLGQPGRTHCDPARGTCEACTSDSHCTGIGQICDPTSRTCTAPPSCVDDTTCTDPARPRCEVGSGLCVACVQDDDCNVAARQTCALSTHTCADFVPCTSDADCEGSPEGALCDTATGDCVACRGDADCIAGTGRTCDTARNLCVGGNRCIDDGGCVGLTNDVCDARLGYCVECLGGSDCADPGATCDVPARLCRDPLPCLNDAECTGAPLTVCDTGTGFCAECLSAADCGSPEAVCVGGICDAGPPGGGRAGSACTQFTDCEAASALPADQYNYYCLEPDDYVIPWKWYEGYCLGFCNSQSECPAGTTCLGGACWDACTADAECRAGYSCQPLQAGGVVRSICAPECDAALISQLACVTDRDCPLGICNQQTGFCGCSPVGGPCVGPGSCRSDAGCIGETDANGDPTGWPGGYCIVVDCDPPAVPCPAGSSCYTLPGDVNACLPDCDPNDLGSCSRANYMCAEVDRYIVGGTCQSSADCNAVAPDCFGASPGVVGTCIRACGSDADCATSQGHVCRNFQDQVSLCADPFQRGACYPGCSTDSDCGVCTADADCQLGQVCSGSRCRTPCSSDAQCGVGAVCAGGLCTIACGADLDCPRGSACAGGGCTVPAVTCDAVARRCDAPCDGDLDCDRSRSCDLTSQSCFTACSAASDDCGPAGRCDPALGECVPDCRILGEICTPDTFCDFDTGACQPRCGTFGSGTCTAPEICDLLTGECVETCSSLLGTACTSSTECGTDQVCWLGNCADRCEDDSQCGPELICQYSYACSPCPTSRWRCDAGGTELCVDCNTDNNCSSRSYCDVGGTWECLERCGGVNGGSRSCNPGEVCDIGGGGLCKLPCAIDADCPDAARPYCDTGSGLCGACADDSHCVGDPAGEACDPLTLTCTVCADDAHCLDPALPACDATVPACVECTDATHCTGHANGELCEPTSQTCVECLLDADCPSITPLCDPSTFTCLPCTADAECAAGELCHFAINGGECHEPCGLVAGQVSGEANIDTGNVGFVDAAGAPANFSHFRGSNDVWAYTLDPASAGAETATIDLLIFGLSVPAGSTVTGVSVEIEASTDGDPAAGGDQWNIRGVLLASGGRIGTPMNIATPLTATDTVHTLGGSTELWGLTLGEADVADVSFGVRLILNEVGGSPDVRARVDRVVLIVHTSIPGGANCDTLLSGSTCNLTENRCQ